jgi:hypothetical protein
MQVNLNIICDIVSVQTVVKSLCHTICNNEHLKTTQTPTRRELAVKMEEETHSRLSCGCTGTRRALCTIAE